MVDMFFKKSSAVKNAHERLSMAMQIQAYLTLVWPGTHAKFATDWRKASAVIAKNYETPRFMNVSARWVPVDLALEKNRDENEKYIELLLVEDSQLSETRYVHEIQIKNHERSLDSALARVDEFRQLAESIKRDGIRRPIFLVDVSAFDLPYKMYRFDGHHRAICAKHLGLARVPAFIFKVTKPAIVGPDASITKSHFE